MTNSHLAEVGWSLADAAGGITTALTQFLASLPRPPQVLALGEPTHLAEQLTLLRNQVFIQLVEQAGYRSIALESDALSALAIDDYVAGGPGELNDIVAKGLSHGWGGAASNRELVAWIRDWNAAHDPGDRIRFAGIDAPTEIPHAPSPRTALLVAYHFLATHLDDPDLLPADPAIVERLAGPDDRWSRPEAMMDPTASIGRTPETAELRLLTDELIGLLDSESPHLIAVTSAAALGRARLHARTAAGLLHYHATMAEASPRRMSRLMGQRDAMMAANIAALVQEETERGPTLLYAHNAHLQHRPSSMQLDWGPFSEAMTWWSAGAITAARLGDRYAWVAVTIGCGPERGIGQPAPGTVEGELDALASGPLLVDARRFDTALRTAGRVPLPRTDTLADHSYVPFDADHLDDVAGILYIPRIGPMTPSLVHAPPSASS